MLQKDGTPTQSITTIESRLPWCETLEQGLLLCRSTECTIDHTGHVLHARTDRNVYVNHHSPCLVCVSPDRANLLHGSSHLVGGQVSRPSALLSHGKVCLSHRTPSSIRTLRSRTSTVMSLLPYAAIFHSGSGAEICASDSGQREKWATAEQVQEVLQRLQLQEQRIAALEMQLQIESARTQTAEQERSALIQTLVTTLNKSSGKRKGQERLFWLWQEKQSQGPQKQRQVLELRQHMSLWSGL